MARKKTRRGTTRKKTTSRKTRRTKRRGRPPGSKTRRKTTRKKTARKKTGRRGRPRTLSTLSSEQLRSELDRRLDELQQRRQELRDELDLLEEELGFLGGAAESGRTSPATTTTRKKRGRPRKTSKKRGNGRRTTAGRTRRRGRGGQANLADSLHKVLRGREMGISEMSQAVKKSGYHTSSSNFTAVVSQTLGRNPDLFKKIGRGRYTTR